MSIRLFIRSITKNQAMFFLLSDLVLNSSLMHRLIIAFYKKKGASIKSLAFLKILFSVFSRTMVAVPSPQANSERLL